MCEKYQGWPHALPISPNHPRVCPSAHVCEMYATQIASSPAKNCRYVGCWLGPRSCWLTTTSLKPPDSIFGLCFQSDAPMYSPNSLNARMAGNVPSAWVGSFIGLGCSGPPLRATAMRTAEFSLFKYGLGKLFALNPGISLGQYYPFGRSTGAPRQCLGAPDLLKHRKIGLGKSYSFYQRAHSQRKRRLEWLKSCFL